MPRGLPPAYRAVKARNDERVAVGKTSRAKLVPLTDEPRPNRALIGQFPKLGEEGPRGLRALVRGRIVAHGLQHQHEAISIGSTRGLPDEYIWGRGGSMWRELKGWNGRLTVVQLDRIQSLRDCGVDADVWWAEDWYLGTIENQLLKLTRRVMTPLPRLVGTGQPGAPGPVRDPAVKARGCGCPVDADHLPTCVWGGG